MLIEGFEVCKAYLNLKFADKCLLQIFNVHKKIIVFILRNISNNFHKFIIIKLKLKKILF